MSNLELGRSAQELLLDKHPDIEEKQAVDSAFDIAKNMAEEDDDHQNELEKEDKQYTNNLITKWIDDLPYQSVSGKYAYKYANVLLKPVRRSLTQNNSFKPTNRWPIRAINQVPEHVGRKKMNMTYFYGIVSGYRIHITHNQAIIFVLLRNLIGSHHDHPVYIADHLWVDPSFIECFIAKENGEGCRIGLGDVVQVCGAISKYRGKIGHHMGYKYSLKNAYIVSSGYPEFKNGHFQYGFISYPHDRNCLYYVRNGRIRLGNQISKHDKDFIRSNHFEVGNYAKVMCAREVAYWKNHSALCLNYTIKTPMITTDEDGDSNGEHSVDFYLSDQIGQNTLISKDETTITTEAEHLVWIRLKNRLKDHFYEYLLSIPSFLTR